jgi:hypothetical protein
MIKLVKGFSSNIHNVINYDKFDAVKSVNKLID